jgi:hypothetical protein
MNDHTHLLPDQVQGVEKLLTSLLSRIKQETRDARRLRHKKIPDSSSINVLGERSGLYQTLHTRALSEKYGRHKNSPSSNALKDELHKLQVFLLTTNFSHERPEDDSSVDFPLQVEFAVDLALNLGVAALHAPTVRKVIDMLEVVVRHDAISMSLRHTGRELLKAIFDAIIPAYPDFPWNERSLSAMRRRLEVLENYELVHKTLKSILKKDWHNDNALLMKLDETFPDILKEKLKSWIEDYKSKPAHFAQEMLAYHFFQRGGTISSAGTVDKILKQARRDRKRQSLEDAKREVSLKRMKEELSRTPEGLELLRLMDS